MQKFAKKSWKNIQDQFFHLSFIFSLSLLLSSCFHRHSYWPQNDGAEDLSILQERYRGVNTKRIIIIDPGHGGKDFGAQNHQMGLVEKRLTLRTAKMLSAALKRMGYTVAMTRHSDIYVGLDERVKFANKLPNCLFVSIHFNSAKATSAQGVEVFYFDDPKQGTRSYNSKLLASSVMSHIHAATDCENRGVKIGAFRVIKSTLVPAILIEGGFITNIEEGRKLAQMQYLHKLAKSIATGVAKYEKSTRHLKYLR